MKYIKYRNMVVKYQGNTELVDQILGKEVLGKGNIEIIENWCGYSDYVLEFVESTVNNIKYGDKHLVIQGNMESILKTSIIQVLLFMLYQKRNLKENIVSLHAAAVIKGDDELIIFAGGKGSGKTSISYLLNMKYDDIMLVANDYIELKVNNDNTFTIVFSDYNNEITFRSHVLYNLDKDLYKQIMKTDEYVFNQNIKAMTNFVDLDNGTIKCNKLSIYFVGVGKTGEFEVSQKTGVDLEIELYKELVQYVRGKTVAAICEDRKRISNFYIDSGYFFSEDEAKCLFPLIKSICLMKNVKIEWVRGNISDIEKYILRS